MYVDRDGTPITLERWAQLIETDGYMRLAETHVGDIRVSTIWVGIDHGLEHPNAFETMTFPTRIAGDTIPNPRLSPDMIGLSHCSDARPWERRFAPHH